jgi:hypothetical protein
LVALVALVERCAFFGRNKFLIHTSPTYFD